MEETETEQEFFEGIWVLAVIEFFVVKILIGTKEIVSETFRRFNGHLDRILEDRNGEFRIRHRGEPETEITMHLIVEIFHQFLQYRSPTDTQVAVLQQYPASFDLFFFDHFLRNRSLALTQRRALEAFAHALFFSKTFEIANRIRTSRQNENQWRLNGTILVTLGKVKCGRNDIIFAQFLADIVLNGRNQFVRTQTFKQKQLLENV